MEAVSLKDVEKETFYAGICHEDRAVIKSEEELNILALFIGLTELSEKAKELANRIAWVNDNTTFVQARQQALKQALKALGLEIVD